MNRQPKRGPVRVLSPIVATCAVVLALYIGLVGFRSFLFEPFHFPSESMYPTVPERSLVFVKKWGYGDYGSMGWRFARAKPSASVARGDLLLFRLNDGRGTVYLKRVVGLPGERIQCRNQEIAIDGQPIPSQLQRTDARYRYVRESIDGASYTVAHLLTIPARDCDVVVPEGHYFMLGDNRANSRDSRYLGTVASDQLVGRVASVIPLGPSD